MAKKTLSFGWHTWIKACLLPVSKGLLRVLCWQPAISHPTRLLPALYIATLTPCQSCRGSSLRIHYSGADRVIQTHRHLKLM